MNKWDDLGVPPSSTIFGNTQVYLLEDWGIFKFLHHYHHLGKPNDFGGMFLVIVILLKLIIQNTAVVFYIHLMVGYVASRFGSADWNRLSSRISYLPSQAEINNSAIIKGSWYNHPIVQYTNWTHHEYACLRVAPFIEFRNGFILPKWYLLTFLSF